MYIRDGLSFEAGERFRLHCERETDPKDVRSIGATTATLSFVPGSNAVPFLRTRLLAGVAPNPDNR